MCVHVRKHISVSMIHLFIISFCASEPRGVQVVKIVCLSHFLMSLHFVSISNVCSFTGPFNKLVLKSLKEIILIAGVSWGFYILVFHSARILHL